MRKSNDKEKKKSIGYMLLAFAAFVFSIGLIFTNWQEYEAMKKDNEQIQQQLPFTGKQRFKTSLEGHIITRLSKMDSWEK